MVTNHYHWVLRLWVAYSKLIDRNTTNFSNPQPLLNQQRILKQQQTSTCSWRCTCITRRTPNGSQITKLLGRFQLTDIPAAPRGNSANWSIIWYWLKRELLSVRAESFLGLLKKEHQYTITIQIINTAFYQKDRIERMVKDAELCGCW